MTEQNTQTNAPGQPPKDSPPLFHEYGLLEQFNLPPKAIRFIRANQRRIWTGVIACAALVLLIAGIDAFRDYRVKKAAEALDAAMQAGGAQREQLAGVARKYGSTPSAQWAEVALARLDEREGKPEEAIARYRKLRGKFPKTSPLQPMLLGKMAALEERREQWDAALALYKELGGNNDFAADAFLGMARIHEARGNKDEALAMYRKFVEYTGVSTEESGVDPRRQMVMSHMDVLGGAFVQDAQLTPAPEAKQETAPAAAEQPAEPQVEAAPETPAVAEAPAETQAEAAPETPAATEETATPQAEAAPEPPAASEQPGAPQAEAPQAETTSETPAAPEQAEAPQAPATSEQPTAPQAEAAQEAPTTSEEPATPQPETPSEP